MPEAAAEVMKSSSVLSPMHDS